jgi:hypothetical protein
MSDSPNTCPDARAPLVRSRDLRCVEWQTLFVRVAEPFRDGAGFDGFLWDHRAGVWIDLLALRRRGEMEH